MTRSAVQRCSEWKRIDALPRRAAGVDDATIDALTAALLRPGAVGRLRSIQAQALLEVLQHGGLLGPIRVGGGKTLITFLAPTVLGAQRPVLLVPAKLRDKTIHEYVEAQRTWLVHPRLGIDSYEMQSRPDHAQRMLDHDPDCLICDECHKLKSPTPAVTRRITRFIQRGCATHETRTRGCRAHAATTDGCDACAAARCAACDARRVFVIMLSGTLIRSGIRDCAHLSDWALGASSPIPRTWNALETWSAVLDQRRDPDDDVSKEAGALLRWSDGTSVEDVRQGFRDRVRQSPGVIATYDAGPDIPLVIDAWTPPADPEITAAVAAVADAWQLPDGRDLEDPLRRCDALNTLALGFWYRWRVEPPTRWLHTRRLWAWFVRQTIKRTELDSVESVARAVRAGAVVAPMISTILDEREPGTRDPPVWDVEHDRTIAESWHDTAPTFEPETEVVWYSDARVRGAAAWAQATGGIVWTEFPPFGRALDAAGVPYYGAGGLRAGVMIERAPVGPVAASVRANSEGRNLQHQWCRNLITSMRGGRACAAEQEQLLARTHRDGQPADAVHASIMLAHEHQIEAFARTLNGARFLEQTSGQPQKLTLATNATGVG